MTKIFLDTEFTGLHQHASLVSIAMVAETGEEFYAEFSDYDRSQVTEWLEVNVLSKLQIAHGKVFEKKKGCCYMEGDRSLVASALRDWLMQFEGVEIWADVLAYDWVLFCELFGGALKIPENIFYTPFDIGTLLRSKGLTKPVNKYEYDVLRYEFAGMDDSGKHNALSDARMVRVCLQKLLEEG